MVRGGSSMKWVVGCQLEHGSNLAYFHTEYTHLEWKYFVVNKRFEFKRRAKLFIPVSLTLCVA